MAAAAPPLMQQRTVLELPITVSRNLAIGDKSTSLQSETHGSDASFIVQHSLLNDNLIRAHSQTMRSDWDVLYIR